ncbi:MAG: ATP-binding protein [Pseudomonadota bacterium]
MKNLIIGRAEEIKVLQSLLSSSSPEFLAIYGRRRVGKTFLIKQFFQTKKVKFFSITGEKNAIMREQIIHFTKQISHLFYNDVVLEPKKIGMKLLNY